ncbi:MAG: hypothetical protein H0S79_11610 [Anaerolineaceae bacterium]|jgi:hypothetical protein|nr:hypothetical protein [Anaerolineaceae bacterium]
MDNPTNPENSNEEQGITLRCNKCNRPITPSEAVLTPTGYRCRDCVRQQQKIFDTSKPLDYVLGFLLAALVSYLGSLLAARIGFFIFLLGPATGVAAAEVVRFATKKRRSKALFRLFNAGLIVGGIPRLFILLVTLFWGMDVNGLNFYALLPLVYQIIFLALAVPAGFYRLSGKQRL